MDPRLQKPEFVKMPRSVSEVVNSDNELRIGNNPGQGIESNLLCP